MIAYETVSEFYNYLFVVLSLSFNCIFKVPLELVIEANNYLVVCLCSHWDGEGVAGRCGSCQRLCDLSALGGSVHAEGITRHFTGQMSRHYSQHWNYWLPVREAQWKRSRLGSRWTVHWLNVESIHNYHYKPPSNLTESTKRD